MLFAKRTAIIDRFCRRSQPASKFLSFCVLPTLHFLLFFLYFCTFDIPRFIYIYNYFSLTFCHLILFSLSFVTFSFSIFSCSLVSLLTSSLGSVWHFFFTSSCIFPHCHRRTLTHTHTHITNNHK